MRVEFDLDEIGTRIEEEAEGGLLNHADDPRRAIHSPVDHHHPVYLQ